MLTKDGLTYKPLLKKECAMREIMFYEYLKNSLDKSLTEMKHLVPKYYGEEKVSVPFSLFDPNCCYNNIVAMMVVGTHLHKIFIFWLFCLLHCLFMEMRGLTRSFS